MLVLSWLLSCRRTHRKQVIHIPVCMIQSVSWFSYCQPLFLLFLSKYTVTAAESKFVKPFLFSRINPIKHPPTHNYSVKTMEMSFVGASMSYMQFLAVLHGSLSCLHKMEKVKKNKNISTCQADLLWGYYFSTRNWDSPQFTDIFWVDGFCTNCKMDNGL